jgi:hypothetical protein
MYISSPVCLCNASRPYFVEFPVSRLYLVEKEFRFTATFCNLIGLNNFLKIGQMMIIVLQWFAYQSFSQCGTGSPKISVADSRICVGFCTCIHISTQNWHTEASDSTI